MFEESTVKFTQTPKLDIGYFEGGPEDGPVAILVHGWPDDPVTWEAVASKLIDEGWHVIAPYLRGFGATTLRSKTERRTGDLPGLGQDLLDFADALNLGQFAVVGHDWGARAAYIVACVAPERTTHCVGISVGWGTNDPTQKLSLKQAQNYWYHWYMALDRGADLVRNDRNAYTKHILDIWSVKRKPRKADLERLAKTFENPDWAEVVLHSYRVRWGLETPDPSYNDLTARIDADPKIRVPTLAIHGAADPCNDPSTSEGKEGFFTSVYRRELLVGVGHFPQWEAPEETASLVLQHLGSTK